CAAMNAIGSARRQRRPASLCAKAIAPHETGPPAYRRPSSHSVQPHGYRLLRNAPQ
ncbi:unnamed protein product, partial [Ostreobium quekettii]